MDMQDRQRKPPKPKGLSTRGNRVWDRTLGEYTFREDELAILTDYVHELSLIDRLESEIEGCEALIRASHGGYQANPLFAELRMHRSTAMQLWKALKLPELDYSEADDSGDVKPPIPMTRQAASKAANDARWGK